MQFGIFYEHQLPRALTRRRGRSAPADSALRVIVALGKQQAIQDSADGKTANFGRGDLQVPLEDPLKNKG